MIDAYVQQLYYYLFFATLLLIISCLGGNLGNNTGKLVGQTRQTAIQR